MYKKYITTLILSIVSIIVSHASVLADTLSLQNKNDSLSYAIGRSDDINGLMSYIKNQTKLDTTSIRDFKRGFIDFLSAEGDSTFEAYCSGIMAARMITEQVSSNMSSVLGPEYKLNSNLFFAGLVALLNNDNCVMTDTVANCLFSITQEKIRENESLKLQEEAKHYLLNNKTEDVIELPSGLQYKITKKGKGANITLDDNIVIEYICKSISGEIIEDSKYHSPDGLILDVSKTFIGLKEGLLLMKKGAEYTLYIPHNLLMVDGTPILSEYPLVIYEVKIVNVRKKTNP